MDKKISKKIEDMEGTFKIFSEKHRIEIIIFLKAEKERSVGEIADYLGISFRATSKHLLHLTDKGILKRRYDTPFVLYRISGDLPPATRLIISQLLS